MSDPPMLDQDVQDRQGIAEIDSIEGPATQSRFLSGLIKKGRL
jgi:hypothetical protein